MQKVTKRTSERIVGIPNRNHLPRNTITELIRQYTQKETEKEQRSQKQLDTLLQSCQKESEQPQQQIESQPELQAQAQSQSQSQSQSPTKQSLSSSTKMTDEDVENKPKDTNEMSELLINTKKSVSVSLHKNNILNMSTNCKEQYRKYLQQRADIQPGGAQQIHLTIDDIFTVLEQYINESENEKLVPACVIESYNSLHHNLRLRTIRDMHLRGGRILPPSFADM